MPCPATVTSRVRVRSSWGGGPPPPTDHGAAGSGESLAIVLRPGNAGSNTAADHIEATGGGGGRRAPPPPPPTAATARTRARWCLGASRSQHDRPLLPRQRNWESTTKQARYFWSRRTTTGQRA
jgi:hypothetical protein